MITEIKKLTITKKSNVSVALEEMFKYRSMAASSRSSYRRDAKVFEDFLTKIGYKPTLENGGKIHLVNKWVKEQAKNDFKSATIQRRLASLATVYKFYTDLAIVQVNPFSAIKPPVGDTGSFSYTPTVEDLKHIYKAIHDLRDEGTDIEVPLKLLLFTGLRNSYFSELRVKHIDFDNSLLVYRPVKPNSKQRAQTIPLPPKLLDTLRNFISERNLSENDALCYGLKGHAVRNKQMNRMVDAINKNLDWTEDKRMTPHGFRYSIATYLSEQGVDETTIQFFLGHANSDNVSVYIRRNRYRIRLLEKHINKLEEDLEASLDKDNIEDTEQETTENKVVNSINLDTTATNTNEGKIITKSFLLELAEKNPKLAESIILKQCEMEQANAS